MEPPTPAPGRPRCCVWSPTSRHRASTSSRPPTPTPDSPSRTCARPTASSSPRQAVLGRLQALWSESIRPDDREAQQRALELYREAVGLADSYGVSTVRPSAQVAADRAYQSGQFLLAKRILDDLLASNPAAADRALLRRYYATMRNLGVALAGGASADARDEGVGLLVAAYLIDERYRLEQGEATRDLVALLGPDRAHWQAPAASPLLAPSDRPVSSRPRAPPTGSTAFCAVPARSTSIRSASGERAETAGQADTIRAQE